MFDIQLYLHVPICDCFHKNPSDEYKNKEWQWSIIKVDGKNFVHIKCTKCGASIQKEASAGCYLKDNSAGNVTRKMTKHESEMFDILISSHIGEVVHQFEDGFTWINLKTTHSEYEGNLMHHCGDSKRGVLWSLRKPDGYPCVTITVDSDNIIIYAKGKKNSDVAKKHVKYIYALLRLDKVKEISEKVDIKKMPFLARKAK